MNKEAIVANLINLFENSIAPKMLVRDGKVEKFNTISRKYSELKTLNESLQKEVNELKFTVENLESDIYKIKESIIDKLLSSKNGSVISQ